MKYTSKMAVIGAGITGLCVAYELSQRKNIALDIFDPAGFPANNASFMAGGMLAPYAEIEHMPPHWIEAGLEGISFWTRLKNTHQNCGFDVVQNGSLLICHEEDRYILDRFKSYLPDGCFETISPQEHEPDVPEKFQNGVYLKEEAHLHPIQVMSGLCKILAQHSNISLKNEAATPQTLSALYDYVIDCRGMDASEEDSDLRGVKGELLIVRNTEFSLKRPVRIMHPRYPLYIVPRPDHLFMIGATNIESTDDHTVSIRSAMELLSALYSLHSSFSDAQIIEIKAGIRPSYPDNLPRITHTRNIIRCNGLFRHGYLLAPVLARCVRAMIDETKYKFISTLTGELHENHRQRRT